MKGESDVSIGKVQTSYADQLPEEVRTYIIGHYKHYKRRRSKLMRKVGIKNKFVFNQILIELNLPRGEV